MLTAARLLSRAQARGVTFVPDGDLVRFCPASALTPKMIDELRCHKEGILKILRRQAVTPSYGATWIRSSSLRATGQNAWPRDFKVYEGGRS